MKKARALSLICMLCLLLPLSSLGDTPYKTYTVNGYGDVQETQTAYMAAETIVKFGGEAMKTPSDLFVTGDGTIYVADTGNSRILVGNAQNELLGVIGQDVLKSPRGVFVTPDGHVYVADRDANIEIGRNEKNRPITSGAVYEFDADGTLLHTYVKPDNPLYGADLSFLPIKVTVNEAGILFIVCESNTNGVVEISPLEGGTFLGYFGTNYASVSLQTIIYRMILTDAQRAKMVSNIPSTPDNLDIDSRGLIYTVTRGDGRRTLKRLNIAGINLINDSYSVDTPAAVAAGNHDNVYVADQAGYIYEFDSNGELIFVFGGKNDGTQRIGLASMVAAIDVDEMDRLYLLDSNQSLIQMYTPTEFTNLLHEALRLYSLGRYTESKAPLEKVLDMNSLFDVANKAMGRAYFQEEDFDTALSYARLAKDHEGYSDAFWEIRNAWLKEHITVVFVAVIALFVLWQAVKIIDRKHPFLHKARALLRKGEKKRYISDLRYAFHYMRHPIDASYGIAREGRASWAASLTVLAVFIVEFLINKYLCGFLQKTVQDGRYEIFSDIGGIILVVFGLTLCNYLVCTINDGEGSVKKIFTYFCYSLTPYLLITPVIFLLSHVLTRNEQFLITLLQYLAYGWMTVLAVLGMREVNNYTAKETVKVILLTLFTVLILALIIFIIYILWAQVIEFISAIFGEVVYRVG